MSGNKKNYNVNLDRRNFLKTTAATGAIATTGAISSIAAVQSVFLTKEAEAASTPGTQGPDKERYPHLFSPMKIAGHTFKNRILVAPMIYGFILFRENLREIMYKITEEKAKGGAAEVVVGEVPINYDDAG